jgi:hypothetical protein
MELSSSVSSTAAAAAQARLLRPPSFRQPGPAGKMTFDHFPRAWINPALAFASAFFDSIQSKESCKCGVPAGTEQIGLPGMLNPAALGPATLPGFV